MRKPQLLFFAPILEYPPAGGPQLSVVNAVKVLNKISNLHIVTSVNRSQMTKSTETFFRKNSTTLTFSPSNKWSSSYIRIQKLMRRSRRVLAPILSWFDAWYILSYAKKNNIDIFWIDRVLEHSFYVFFWLRKMSKRAFIVADTEAVHSLFILRELPMIQNPIRWLFVWLRGNIAYFYQQVLLKEASVITAVSEVDANFFRAISTSPEKVMRFSNVVDMTEYSFSNDTSPLIDKPALLLLGSFGNINSPMDRAAYWVVNEIMPLVWLKFPKVQLYIIGRNSQITLSDLNSSHVKVIGQVPSILSYLNQANATLVPLRYESGTRFKIIESGAASVPCVSTTLGAEGLDVIHGESILIADDATDFANCICGLLSNQDFALNLGKELNKVVTNKYSLEVQVKEGESIIKRFTLTFH